MENYKQISKKNHLNPEDWRVLAESKTALKEFYEITKELEGRATNGTYDCI